MKIEICLKTKIYKCLLALAKEKGIPFNLFVERFFLEMLADTNAIKKN